MSEDRDDIIVLIDENGDEVEAEYVDTIQFRGSDYVVLLPMDDDDLDEEDGGDTERIIENVEGGAGKRGQKDGMDAQAGKHEPKGASVGDRGKKGGNAGAHNHDHGEDDCGCGCEDCELDCDEEAEIIILKVTPGAEGEEETFVAIDDEEEQDAVFELFMQKLDDEEIEDD